MRNGGKPFATFGQQMDFLANEKHVIIGDRGFAEDMLRRIGYFPLVSGYKDLFRVKGSKAYKPGTTFEEIVALYEFDADLRELFFRHILQVERHLRSLVSYHFTEAHGSSQAAYLDEANYNGTEPTRKVIGILKAATLSDKHEHIAYYRDTYGDIPLWVLITTLTFGKLSWLYYVFPQSVQSAVCKHFAPLNIRHLNTSLHLLTNFRNVCAHGERLFTYTSRSELPDLSMHRKLGLPLEKSRYRCGKNDLFAALIALRYLLPRQEFNAMNRRLAALIDKAVRRLAHISRTELQEHMGFPENWRKISMFRLPRREA